MNKLARNLAWLVIIVLAFVALATCSGGRIDAAPLEQPDPTPPVQFFELRAGIDSATWMYTADPASVDAVRYVGTCPVEAAGVWYYNADGEPTIIPFHHGKIGIEGATAYVGDYLGQDRIVAGAWFRMAQPWAGFGGAGTGGPGGYNTRRDSLPLGVRMLDGVWKEPWIVQCVGGPFLPLVLQ